MKQPAPPEISKAEYQVLDVLWEHGEASVREVHDMLDNGWAYSTTKTVVDRMVRKGLVAREKLHGLFIYKAEVSRPAGLARWLRFFADQILGVDTRTAVAMFGQGSKLDDRELSELRELAEQLEEPEQISRVSSEANGPG